MSKNLSIFNFQNEKMRKAFQPLYEINHRAIQVLCREIGIVNTLRFIRQFTPGFGDYIQEHDDLQKETTVAGIVAEIKAMKKKNGADE